MAKKEKKTFKEAIRAVKFTIVSISAGLVQIGLFALFNEAFAWTYWVAYLLSLLASILWNFTINRKVTFQSSKNVKTSMALILAFYAVFTPLSTWLGDLAERGGANEYVVLAATMVANFVLEFLYTRFFVYRNDCDTLETKTEGKQNAKKPLLFRFTVGLVRIFYRKRTFIGMENLPKEPSIVVGNHAQIHGPITSQVFFPTYKYIWCVGQMMHVKEVPEYAYTDFWSKKPKYIRWFFKLASYIIAPFSAYYFTKADTIAVYKDSRLISTFRNTLRKLNDGAHIVIYPEEPQPYNDIVNEFQDKFVDVARLYYKRTGKALSFVPMYNAPKLKTVVFGKPIVFDPEADIETQREEICTYLKEEITSLAKSLPRHKVVPYLNVGAKNYKYSK